MRLRSKTDADFKLLMYVSIGLFTELIIEMLRLKGIMLTYETEVYNLYIRLEYIFYLLYFQSIFESKRIKKLVLLSILPFAIIMMIETLSHHPGTEFFYKWTYVTGGILATIWAIISLFLIEPKSNVKIISLPQFWVSFAIIIFYAGILPFNVLYADLFDDTSFDLLNQLIPKTFNVIFYLFLTVAFVCSWRLNHHLS
uniref:hypothetical protein n=1 Tax=Roseivirga sp. TaxID=1964215 RepID=UPI004047C1FC